MGLILAGHYLGDESGVLRITGASTLAFGIAKAKEYQNNPDLDTISKRLSGAKDDFLTAFHLKWKKDEGTSAQEDVIEQKPLIVEDPVKKQVKPPKVESVDKSEVNGELDVDFSRLTSFELKNKELANAFEKEQANQGQSDDLNSEIDDNPDLSLI